MPSIAQGGCTPRPISIREVSQIQLWQLRLPLHHRLLILLLRRHCLARQRSRSRLSDPQAEAMEMRSWAHAVSLLLEMEINESFEPEVTRIVHEVIYWQI